MRKNILVALLFSFYSSIAFANPACFSNNEKLGDSAYWSITAIELFNQKRYEDAVAVVDLCFDIWGPEAQKIQKEMHDNDEAAPAVGKVSPKQKKAIQENFLMNDVSMALWTKANSLDKLGIDTYAIEAYVECINMTHGRVWDSGGYEPNGWFWSPAEDCANKVKKFVQ
ncbi:hypothetical protein N9J57_00155 [Gammaproteobacteria bacterium]|nr:hypothetical protein [Gammaproteobacteria bacterium]MDA8998588.1 hypothetical protein [Gammaproteobacteria bacterium]